MAYLKSFSFASFFFLLSIQQSVAKDVSIRVEKKYINLPVSNTVQRAKMIFEVDGKQERSFLIRLATVKPDYWVFCDVSYLKGKTIKISYEGSDSGMSKIYQDDVITGNESLYKEKYRPQYHYTVKRGWQNDPNGLVYFGGEYHLFYQFNPYETRSENMHWGHAVSTDLVHWQELAPALYPFELGAIFSGSSVIDYNNTAGFNKGNEPAMIAAFTTEQYGREKQSIAYSNDKGRNWTMYKNNPVLETKSRWHTMDTRDPKVFWYEPNKNWVMALFELNGISIYTSNNLKKWNFESHITMFCECPELFELAVDGNPNNKKWVIYGGSGTYMTGKFDGHKFTPEAGKYFYRRGTSFAAQTFNNIPASDGRRIEMAWGRISTPSMPFNQMMLLPTELTLKTTKDGIRLCSNPVKELDQLHQSEDVWHNIAGVQANEYLKQFKNLDCIRIKTTFRYWDSRGSGLSLDGQRILEYDTNHNLVNGVFYSPDDMTSMELTADIFIDKTSIEVFIDDGRYSYTIPRMNGNFEPANRYAYWTPALDRSNKEEGLRFWGDNIQILDLKVNTMKSIW